MRLARAAIAALLTAVVAVLVVTPAAPAQAKEWRIDSMDVVLEVQQSSDVIVEETVTFTFEGSFRFVGRVIPTRNLDALKDIDVRQNGVSLPRGSGPGTWDTFTEGDNRIIQVNFALTDVSETWTFRYRAVGAIQYFDQGDELRWYVFDADTPVPIDRVRVKVKLPGAVASDQLSSAVQTGSYVSSRVTSPSPRPSCMRARAYRRTRSSGSWQVSRRTWSSSNGRRVVSLPP